MTTVLDRTPALKPYELDDLPDQPSGGRLPATSSRPAPGAEPGARVLLTRLADLPDDHPDRPGLRERVVVSHLPLAEYLARRFRNRGEASDDLNQVASLGLIKAVDGYDVARGVEFTSYAIPTIVGELKRHFRDKGWAVRVPRRLQEMKLEITKATGVLTQQLGRSPTVADLASHLGVTEEEVCAGLDSANAYSTLSLHTPVSGDDSAPEIIDLMGDVDPALATVEDRQSLRPLLAELPVREQRIIAMRFFGNLTQSQIAEKVGISQMHVSRLLARSITQLREGLLTD